MLKEKRKKVGEKKHWSPFITILNQNLRERERERERGGGGGH
jgi:hypothetical protein